MKVHDSALKHGIAPHEVVAVNSLRLTGGYRRWCRSGWMPLVTLGSATILKEARWLAYLGEALPVAVPEIVALGEPGHGYPERWSVVRWIAGQVAVR